MYKLYMSLSKLGVGDGQEGLACCDSWGRKESDMTERLNWTDYFAKKKKKKTLFLKQISHIYFL